jgi:hypothetical protein
MPRGATTSGFPAFAAIRPACTLGMSQSPWLWMTCAPEAAWRSPRASPDE